MKKLFFSCVLLLFLVPICSFAKINVTGVPLGESRIWDSISTTKSNTQSFEILREMVLLPKDSYDEAAAIEMVRRISKVDNTILWALQKSDVKIKLFTGVLTDEPAFKHLKGVQPKGWSEGKTWGDVPGAGGTSMVAARIGSSEPGADHGSINLELHEVAHSIDKIILQEASKKREFIRIWKKEATLLFPKNDYFLKYPEEYLAEAFAMFYLNDKTKTNLQVNAPKTYKYIEELEELYLNKEILTHL